MYNGISLVTCELDSLEVSEDGAAIISEHPGVVSGHLRPVHYPSLRGPDGSHTLRWDIVLLY